jgi:transcriptional regulator with XRE-family HTH domain
MGVVMRLRELRESKGLSLHELASRSGMSAQTIDRFERGNDRPSFKSAKKLANALGLNPKELMAQPKVTTDDEFATHRFARVQSTIDAVIAESIEEKTDIDHDKVKASLMAIMGAYLRAAEAVDVAANEYFSDGFKRHMEERYQGPENSSDFEAVHELYSKLVTLLGWEAIPWYP